MHHPIPPVGFEIELRAGCTPPPPAIGASDVAACAISEFAVVGYTSLALGTEGPLGGATDTDETDLFRLVGTKRTTTLVDAKLGQVFLL
ncbi:MAG: hypothetical protein ALECFALPRED_009977 [Alectoria fallacina]|uniref:Uncharacterized protein n=1 Tax=Alectoria fallacina TaxID=1903189 RepID=A0A8H3IGP9_9LECA|nr:MAG: hypothetical protein ALECFALPRED_009977 [Alectoria fallacina]